MGSREQWAALAQELGFEHKPGLKGFLASETGKRELEERAKRGEIPSADISILDNPLIASLLEAVFNGALVGKHRSYDVTVFGASEGRETSPGANRSFAVTLSFKEGYDLGLNVYNESFLSRVGKLFGQQDIQLGDKELDDTVMIKGRDVLAVKQLLDSQRVRQQLLKMYAESKCFVIRDYGIRHEESASNLSSARIRQLVEMMADLADALPER